MKILALLVFLVVVATTGPHFELAGICYLAMLLAGVIAGRLPMAGVLRRAAVVLPFSLTFAAISWISGEPRRAVLLMEKSYLSAWATLLLVATTPLPQLLRGLEMLGAPGFLLMVAQFLYRYLFVIADQAHRMRLAGLCRGGRFRRAGGFRAAARAVGVLFVRSYERAGRHSPRDDLAWISGPLSLTLTAAHRLVRHGIRLPCLCPASGRRSAGANLGMKIAPVIAVRDLHFQYDDGTVALAGVDFELFAGETVAVFGANGSGKTTFVLHLNGLLEGRGTVELCGLPVRKDTLKQIRQKVGIVFQDPDDQLFMPSVLEDVAFGPLNLGLPPDQAAARARSALEKVGMLESQNKAPYHLSAGEKKRVAIAGVLAMDPEILVLDEPTTFLDPPGQRALVKLLRELPQAKLIVTHDVELALSLATRAVFFDKGRIAGEGPTSRVIEQFHWSQEEYKTC